MTKISCETEGHLWGPQGKCVMCDTPKPVEQPTSKPILERLRRPHDRNKCMARYYQPCTCDTGNWDELVDAAADEIERLQRQLALALKGYSGKDSERLADETSAQQGPGPCPIHSRCIKMRGHQGPCELQ